MIVKAFLVIFFCMALPSSAMEFQCEFIEGIYKIVGPVYECRVVAVQNLINTRFTGTFGTHLPGKENNNVNFLRLSDLNVQARIPFGIGEVFPNLRVLHWARSNLQSLSLKDLPMNLQFLQILEVPGNNLITLDGNLFRFTRQLKAIDFSSNKLRIINHDLVAALYQLELANFESNECINYAANDRSGISILTARFASGCSNFSTTGSATTTITSPTYTPPTFTSPTVTSESVQTMTSKPVYTTVSGQTQTGTGRTGMTWPAPTAPAPTYSTTTFRPDTTCPIDCLNRITSLEASVNFLNNQNRELANKVEGLINLNSAAVADQERSMEQIRSILLQTVNSLNLLAEALV